jgi:hypothetical protein
MRELLLDVALSFCPASVRSVCRPCSSSRVLLAAILTGITQTVLCARWIFSGYVAFLSLRSQQYEHVIKRANGTTQAWLVLVFFVEYVIFHPFPLILLYLAFEGAVRFVGGLCVSEVVPSLPVVLAFRIRSYILDKRAQRALQPLLSVPDSVEVLSGGERLRIAAALAKTKWNPSVTIGIQGEWYEVEKKEEDPPPRTFVYLLRRAPVGKVLRGYEEYEIPAGTRVR